MKMTMTIHPAQQSVAQRFLRMVYCSVWLCSSFVVLPRLVSGQQQRCGCEACTDQVWNSLAADDGTGSFTCGSRIEWVIGSNSLSEIEACRLVAGVQFPDHICGPFCDPDTCAEEGQVDKSGAPDTTIPSTPNKSDPSSSSSSTVLRCGCNECTEDVWNTKAVDFSGAYSCGARIEWSVANLGLSEEEACLRVAQAEFPVKCGGFACNPAKCDGRQPPALTPEAPLYCFPDYQDRMRYTWSDYIVEAKEGASCGPHNNRFTKDTVDFSSSNGGELTLQFKYQRGIGWSGSEVRVVPVDDQQQFSYGTYTFTVKDIVHQNTNTGEILGNILPPSLILGLFSWDSTELYAINENYNHEVDIEISRWGIPDNEDVQFVVQPPETQTIYRFRSSNGNSLSQANQWYEFTWEPNKIIWTTSSGGGTYYTYSTEDSIDLGGSDRVQCLPANMEIRINLWNFDGAVTPMDMTTDEMVEVVISDFAYTPSDLTHVEDGDYCSKDCQCSSASECVQGTCMSLSTR
jgi:hypothetical protein